MKEFLFRRPQAKHPEVQGQEQAMTPVTQRTLRAFKRSVEGKMGNISLGEVLSTDTTYTVFLPPRRFRKELDGFVMTMHVEPHDPNIESVDYQLKKSHIFGGLQIIKSEDIIEKEIQAEDFNSVPNFLTRISNIDSANQQDQNEIAILTGLPIVNEREIHHIIESINSDTARVRSLE